MWNYIYNDELYHYGVMGMKWGVRRYQNPDGTLTADGKKKYFKEDGQLNFKGKKLAKKSLNKANKRLNYSEYYDALSTVYKDKADSYSIRRSVKGKDYDTRSYQRMNRRSKDYKTISKKYFDTGEKYVKTIESLGKDVYVGQAMKQKRKGYTYVQWKGHFLFDEDLYKRAQSEV